MTVNQCPCFALGLAHRKVVKAYEEALAPLGLTIAQAHFLTCLYHQDGRLAKDVARELGVDAGTLTPMIDRLERQGLVERKADPEDRRATRLCLTPAAEAQREAVTGRCCEVNERLMSKFNADEYDRFMTFLRRFAVEAEMECTGNAPAR